MLLLISSIAYIYCLKSMITRSISTTIYLFLVDCMHSMISFHLSLTLYLFLFLTIFPLTLGTHLTTKISSTKAKLVASTSSSVEGARHAGQLALWCGAERRRLCQATRRTLDQVFLETIQLGRSQR